MVNNKGQASLEGLLVLPLGIATISLLFWATGLGWSYFWARYQLYEAVVCLQDQQIGICKSHFHQKMRSITPYVQIDSFDLQKSRAREVGRCRLSISFLGKHQLELSKQIQR